MYSGILLVDKPRGMTSHDVVDAVRRLTGLRAVGHTGTLDPEASGLLLLCLGRATKCAQFFEGLDKTYWTVLQLGVCTDTQDATGTVTQQCEVSSVEEDQVQSVLTQFTGPIQQVPPMYSAIKHQGERLYRLARQGKIVPRQPREVTIQQLALLNVTGSQLTLRVSCSKGTYIRTLCEDIGLALGYGAHTVELQRCRIGLFKLRDAYKLDQLEQYAAAGRWETLCLPVSDALGFLPPVSVTAQQYQHLRTGQGRAIPELVDRLSRTPPVASSYRLCTQPDTTVAIMYRQDSTLNTPKQWTGEWPGRWKIHQLEMEG